MPESVFPTTVVTESITLREELAGKDCPHCYQPSLQWTESENQIFASCTSCGTRYTLSEPSVTLMEASPDLEQALESMVCPTCHHEGRVLMFRCDLTLKECFYFTGCPNCGRTFDEYR
jgi:transcription elongation factor Elf1